MSQPMAGSNLSGVQCWRNFETKSGFPTFRDFRKVAATDLDLLFIRRYHRLDSA